MIQMHKKMIDKKQSYMEKYGMSYGMSYTLHRYYSITIFALV